jgi:aminoglycoside phosphotransferase (APT) family kinase protein
MAKGALIGRGRTAEIFELGKGRVLKLYFDFIPREAVERELAGTRAATRAGIRAPTVYGLEREEGRIGLVMERLGGESLLDRIARRPAEAFEAVSLLADLHAAMRRSGPEPDLPRLRAALASGIERAVGLLEPEKDEILARLDLLPDGESICHGDLHPGNILMTPEGPVVIDWMSASRGRAIGDLARTELLLATGGLPEGIPIAAKAAVAAARAALAKLYVRRYFKAASGSASENLAAWRLPVLAARLFELNSYPSERRAVLGRIRAELRRPYLAGASESKATPPRS